MNLIEDVKICFEYESLLNRLSVSNGTTQLEGWKGRPRYFPKNSWSPLTREQLDTLWLANDDEWLSGKHIGLVSFPDDIWKPLNRFLFKFEADFFSEKYFLGEHSSDYIKALSPMVDFLPHVLLSTEHLVTIGVVFNQPGLETITINQNRRRLSSGIENQVPYTGLHVDTNGSTHISERHQVPNLLMVNLGNEPRYLLFVNLTLKKITELVLADPPEVLDELYLKFGVRQLFFDKFPDYPVLRLRIDPGEAYIAPFENIFHDGSTLDKVQPDIVLAFQGKFAPARYIPRVFADVKA